MYASEGILTARGGMTSHAAVVARGMGTCCVAGCGELRIDECAKTMTTEDGKVYKEGDWISSMVPRAMCTAKRSRRRKPR